MKADSDVKNVLTEDGLPKEALKTFHQYENQTTSQQLPTEMFEKEVENIVNNTAKKYGVVASLVGPTMALRNYYDIFFSTIGNYYQWIIMNGKTIYLK